MPASEADYERVLARAAAYSQTWLGSLGSRRVPPIAPAEEILSILGGPLPENGSDALEVIDLLAVGAEPGLMAMGSGRFYGWVIGGTLPVALGADWLVSAWDQNTGLRYATPATAAIEEAASVWLLDLLGLPAAADVGFVTGGTMANFTCLAAARFQVFDQVGWNVHDKGLTGAPSVHVLVGAERHDTVDLALQYLGLGRPKVITSDDQGRIELDDLASALNGIPAGDPIVLCLQAGNVHSGAFDPFEPAIDLAHERGAWVHVDGAFGLWAAACPSLAHLVTGMGGADSWATDAHKTLNVPYDCGVAVVADPRALRSAFGMHTSYLIADDSGTGDPCEKVPELSRRARGVPVWAALRFLGRSGVADLVARLVRSAQMIADGISQFGGAEVLNDVVYTQVCAAFGDDDRTQRVCERIIADGTTWMSGSRWRDRAVLRISVSNWSTDEEDVRLSLEALHNVVNG